MTSHAYDALRRKTSETWEDGRVFSFTYDAAGSRWQFSAQVGTNSDFVTVTGFDAANRPVTIEQSGINVLPKRIELTYHSANQLTWLKRYEELGNPEIVASSTYVYDAAGRPTDLIYFDPANAIVADYDYTYDAAARMTQVVLPAAI